MHCYKMILSFGLKAHLTRGGREDRFSRQQLQVMDELHEVDDGKHRLFACDMNSESLIVNVILFFLSILVNGVKLKSF